MMGKLMVRIYTGDNEFFDREMNDTEIAQFEADQAAEAIKLAQAEAQATAKAELLARLGITADEAKLLLA